MEKNYKVVVLEHLAPQYREVYRGTLADCEEVAESYRDDELVNYVDIVDADDES